MRMFMGDVERGRVADAGSSLRLWADLREGREVRMAAGQFTRSLNRDTSSSKIMLSLALFGGLGCPAAPVQQVTVGANVHYADPHP
jgi:hypothetical protein